MHGLDANTVLTEHAACLAKEKIAWAGRYVKHAPTALTRAEAEALSASGLYIVTIAEIGFPTSAGHFTAARGQSDGAFAYRTARDTLRQTPGSSIYFTVDYDATEADLEGPISRYFAAVAQAFKAGGDAYAIGVYGSGLTCSWLQTHMPLQYTWLAMSRGWRGSHSYTGWNICQTTRGTVCGVDVDFDETNSHAGGWKLAS